MGKKKYRESGDRLEKRVSRYEGDIPKKSKIYMVFAETYPAVIVQELLAQLTWYHNQILLEDAVSHGYRPCKNCRPMQKVEFEKIKHMIPHHETLDDFYNQNKQSPKN